MSAVPGPKPHLRRDSLLSCVPGPRTCNSTPLREEKVILGVNLAPNSRSLTLSLTLTATQLPQIADLQLEHPNSLTAIAQPALYSRSRCTLLKQGPADIDLLKNFIVFFNLFIDFLMIFIDFSMIFY